MNKLILKLFDFFCQFDRPFSNYLHFSHQILKSLRLLLHDLKQSDYHCLTKPIAIRRKVSYLVYHRVVQRLIRLTLLLVWLWPRLLLLYLSEFVKTSFHLFVKKLILAFKTTSRIFFDFLSVFFNLLYFWLFRFGNSLQDNISNFLEGCQLSCRFDFLALNL